MSVYVDKIPECCGDCVCNDDDWRCNLNGEELPLYGEKLENCPLKILPTHKDYIEWLEQVRAEYQKNGQLNEMWAIERVLRKAREI